MTSPVQLRSVREMIERALLETERADIRGLHTPGRTMTIVLNRQHLRELAVEAGPLIVFREAGRGPSYKGFPLRETDGISHLHYDGGSQRMLIR